MKLFPNKYNRRWASSDHKRIFSMGKNNMISIWFVSFQSIHQFITFSFILPNSNGLIIRTRKQKFLIRKTQAINFFLCPLGKTFNYIRKLYWNLFDFLIELPDLNCSRCVTCYLEFIILLYNTENRRSTL